MERSNASSSGAAGCGMGGMACQIGMFIIDGIGIVPSGGPNACRNGRLRSALAHLRARGNLRSVVRLMVEIAGE